jgi:hypothetical protein
MALRSLHFNATRDPALARWNQGHCLDQMKSIRGLSEKKNLSLPSKDHDYQQNAVAHELRGRR